MAFPFLPDDEDGFITLKVDGIDGVYVRSGVVIDATSAERQVNRLINDYPLTVEVTVKSEIRGPEERIYFHVSDSDDKKWIIQDRRVPPRPRKGEGIVEAIDFVPFVPSCPPNGDVEVRVAARLANSRRNRFKAGPNFLVW